MQSGINRREAETAWLQAPTFEVRGSVGLSAFAIPSSSNHLPKQESAYLAVFCVLRQILCYVASSKRLSVGHIGVTLGVLLGGAVCAYAA